MVVPERIIRDMFRSVRNTIANRLNQDDRICYISGFMIGAGGFAEATLIGMAVYILVVFSRQTNSHNLFAWSKDIAVVAIGSLLIVYWSYVDPQSLITSVQPPFCSINSNEALSQTELLKIICATIFGISCNHSPLIKIRKLISGVAIGLSLYVIPTITGSIVFQGIRGGGDKVFNIFSGDITAQSTTAGYIVIMMIGILCALKRRKLLLASLALAFVTGIQTSNRSVILFGVLGAIAVGLHKEKKASTNYCIPKIIKAKPVYLGFALATAGIILARSSQIIYSRFIAALEGRLGLYVEGYRRLIDYLLNPEHTLLEDAGYQYWWHSVPLDATRAGNLVGAYLSLFWLAIFIIGIIITLKRKNSGLCLLGFAMLFIYMTGMPLAAGGYEFVALYCGYLLLSNELLNKSPS